MKLDLKRDDPDHGLFRRVGETARPPVRLEVDGAAIEALAGDTLLVALLANGGRLRDSEFGDTARAGFCLMGACQDCWVWTAGGGRLDACTTPVTEGMSIVTRGAVWPGRR
jgi:D-hydroxyproline dehydrogenase subunit gamma